MRLNFHGATTMTSDLAADVATTACAGYGGLELWAAKVDAYLSDHDLAGLQALLAGHSVKPAALNSIEFIGFRTPEDYAAIRARCEALSRLAEAIGCPTVVVVPSPTPDRETRWDQVVAEYVRVLRDLAGIAGPHGIRLAFELLGFGWCSVRTPRGAAEIVRAVGLPNVGMVLDAAHFYAGGGSLAELDGLDPEEIFDFHLDDLEDVPKEAITDATRLLPGQGVVPLGEICSRLQAIGYDGPCSIELFRPEYWSWDPCTLAVQAREAALGLLGPYFRIDEDVQ